MKNETDIQAVLEFWFDEKTSLSGLAKARNLTGKSAADFQPVAARG